MPCCAPIRDGGTVLRRGDSPAPAAGCGEGDAGRFPAGLPRVPVQRGFRRRRQPGCAGARPDASDCGDGVGRGAVPRRRGAWHDDPALLEKLQRRLPPGTARLFQSLHLWGICALIATSRGVVGSSLHGRIVALAYGLPRVSLRPPQGLRPDKRAAFAETWEPQAVPRSVAVGQVETALMQALDVPASVLRENADSLCEQYLQSQAQWAGMLTLSS